MRRFYAFLVLSLLAGCASIDAVSRANLQEAAKLVADQPQAALQKLEPVIDAYPENIAAHRLRGLAFEELGHFDRAAEEWAFIIHVRVSKSGDQLLEAHRKYLAAMEQVIGDLPHKIESPPQGELRDRIVSMQRSCDYLLSEDPEDRGAQLSKAACLYRLGLYHRARPILEGMLRDKPNDAARYLLNLVREQEIGVHRRALDAFCELVRSDDPEVQRHAATHLIRVLDDPKVDAEMHDNICGVLLRWVRSGQDIPDEVANWARRYSAKEDERRQRSYVQTQLDAAASARQQHEWKRGWTLLAQLPDADAQVVAKRTKYLHDWTEELVTDGMSRLANSDVDGARAVAKDIASLPEKLLSAELRARCRDFRAELQRVEQNRGSNQLLTKARKLLADGKAKECLAALDQVEGQAPPAIQKRIDLTRAQALFATGDSRAALTILDHLPELSEPDDRRLYGILLEKAGRSEEAVKVLEGLPLGYLGGEAFQALLEALGDQREWEAVLARLATLNPLPDSYRPMRENACVETARKRLRARDPRGALAVIRSYLDPDELSSEAVLPVYLEALLGTGDKNQAAALAASAEPSRLEKLPKQLRLRLAAEGGPSLSDEARFHLLAACDPADLSPEGRAIFAKLWPRYGSYLPPPGNYALRYRSHTVQEGGPEGEPSYTLLTMRWNEDRFVVTGKDATDERWTVENGVWMRETELGQMQIPVRAQGSPPYPEQQYQLGRTQWVAEVVEAGSEAKVDNKTYAGCLRVRLVPDGEMDESIYLDLAPRIGEVRREVYSKGHLQFVRELVQFSPLN